MKCKKCHSTDIKVIYRRPSEESYVTEHIDNLESYCKNDDKPFLGTQFYTVQKEHLSCVCRTCHYKWCEDTKDSKCTQQ